MGTRGRLWTRKGMILLLLLCSIIDIGNTKTGKHFLIETADAAEVVGSDYGPAKPADATADQEWRCKDVEVTTRPRNGRGYWYYHTECVSKTVKWKEEEIPYTGDAKMWECECDKTGPVSWHGNGYCCFVMNEEVGKKWKGMSRDIKKGKCETKKTFKMEGDVLKGFLGWDCTCQPPGNLATCEKITLH